jgi:hypothetical protein
LLAHLAVGAQTRGLPASDQHVLSMGGNIELNAPTSGFDMASTQRPKPINGGLSFNLNTLESLPQRQFTTMTPWSDKPIQFSGPLMRDVLAIAGAKGQNIRATAINDYRINIPVQDAMRFDMIVATRMNGERMSVRDKGPLFVVYPFDSLPELQQARYYERSIWQLKSLEVE